MTYSFRAINPTRQNSKSGMAGHRLLYDRILGIKELTVPRIKDRKGNSSASLRLGDPGTNKVVLVLVLVVVLQNSHRHTNGTK